VSVFAKELNSSVAQKPANSVILKVLLHAENHGAQGLIIEDLLVKLDQKPDVLKAALQELEEYGLVSSFVPNNIEIFYGLTDPGRRVANQLK